MAEVETRGRTIKWARFYDLGGGLLHAERPSGYFARILDIAGLEPGDRLLDCGCGPGRLPLSALERIGSGGRAVGIDASPRMVERAGRNAADRGSAAEFLVAVIEDLPFDGGCFDVVTTSLVLHHLPGDVLAVALGEMFRVLSPGGRMVVVDSFLATPRLRALLHFSHHLSTDVLDRSEVLVADAGFESVERGSVSRLFGYLKAAKPATAA